MIRADDLASVLISRQGSWMDAWTLQKLLYYVQAWHLAITNEPAFPENIKGWRDGPVVPAVRVARQDQSTRRPAAQRVEGVELDEMTSNIVDLVLATYGSMTGAELSALTHTEQPWNESRAGLPQDAEGHRVISRQSMARFYRANRRLGGRTAADLAAAGIYLRSRDPDAGPVDVDSILAELGPEFQDPGEDPWGGGNRDDGADYGDGRGIEERPHRSYAGA